MVQKESGQNLPFVLYSDCMKENIDYLKNVLGVKYFNKASGNAVAKTRLMFVGESIGSQEAQLLSKMIEAMGISPKEVSVVNSFEQVDLIKPEFVVLLSEKREQTLDFKNSKILTTFHPSYLLKNPSAKKEVWEDLKVVMKYLGLKGK